MSIADSYQQLLDGKQVDAINILEFHFSEIVKTINRRISTKQKYSNPWKIQLNRVIHHSCFIQFYKAIRDFKTHFFTTITTKKNKYGNTVFIEIHFSNVNVLKLHLDKITRSKLNINKLLCEKSFTGGIHGTVIALEEKPCIMKYDCVKHILKFEIHYQITNRYGNVCSF